MNERLLVRIATTAATAGVAAVAFVAAVVVVAPTATSTDRGSVVLLFLLALLVTAAIAPLHRWVEVAVSHRLQGERESPDEALRVFSTRMSRAVPMEEVLLQLAETLQHSMRLTSAQVWTGPAGRLERSVAVPAARPAVLQISAATMVAVTRTQPCGASWLQVWMPELLSLVERDDTDIIRVAMVTHLGDLFGIIVATRPLEAGAFSDREDRALADLAQQLGLALHNVGLDAALQDSLVELRQRNRELQRSRARIVEAGDRSRRALERDLHDGAQQHLVAVGVRVGLLAQHLDPADEVGTRLLDEVRAATAAATDGLRELAHGLYPPLLREQGLHTALEAAATRCPTPTTLRVTEARFRSEVESTVYFCCLEALQNVAKHAGPDAEAQVVVTAGDELEFEVTDDGVGFDPEAVVEGNGFENMRDRLGAVNGHLILRISEGGGVTVGGVVPLDPGW